MEASLFDSEAHTPPSLRRAVAGRGGEVPAELRVLIAKIGAHAHQITDEDLAALASRYSDDERFEIVVAASVGSAFARLDRALALFGDE